MIAAPDIAPVTAAVATAPHGAGPQVVQTLPWTPPSPSFRITVTVDGIYALGHTYLSAAGLPVGDIDPRTFRMFWMGEEIPIVVPGESDGVFDPADRILFFGRSIDSLYWQGLLGTNKYTAGNVYWLSYGGANGLRTAQRTSSGAGTAVDAFPDTIHSEKQFSYLSNRPFAANVDHWFGDRPQAFGGNPGSVNVAIALANRAVTPYPATLAVRLLGDADGPHHLRLYANNNLVLDGSPTWNGNAIYETSAAISQSLLLEANNVIKIELANDAGPTKLVDRAYIDWVELTYGDTLVAENNELDFRVPGAGLWSYALAGFSQPDIIVFDVTDPFFVTEIINGSATGANPFGMAFGDAGTAATRYWAASSAGWRTPAGIGPAIQPVSPYTPSDLLDTGNQADYLLITHGAFWAQALVLAGHRSADYQVAVIDVQSIYDRFNGGMRSAEAIRDFIAYAHGEWAPPQPGLVLLMGDGTNDMRNYRNQTPTFIPPFLALVDPTLGETGADNRFVMLDSGVTPDSALGRFPVNSSAEAANLVAKTVNYETLCDCNTWNYNLLFVSDNVEGGGGNFWDYSDAIADGYADEPANTVPLIPDIYTVTKLYMGRDCDVTNPSSAVGCRNAITTTLNMTRPLFISYTGHATKTYWALEQIMNQAALATLDNAVCLPIALPMTCYEGSFMEPGLTFSSFGEAFVRLPTNGAVASWSPTGSGLASGHDYLQRGLMLALFHENITRLGPAIVYAKQYTADNAPPNKYNDLIETFTLFGDPALEAKTQALCNRAPTGIEVASFEAVARAGGVEVRWQTTSEHDVLGFRVLRREAGDLGEAHPWVVVTPEQVLARRSGTRAGADYAFEDTSAAPSSSYRYRLEIITLAGGVRSFGAADVTTFGYRLHFPHVRNRDITLQFPDVLH